MSAPTPTRLSTLATELASIEAEVKLTSANLSQIRSNRQRSAVGVIQEAVSLTTSSTGDAMAYSEVRGTLLSHGILKGTVSKILTVVQALNDGVISPSDVRSLNSGYAAVKLALAVHSSPEPSSSSSTAATSSEHVCPPPAPPTPPTPDEALEVILHTIKTSGDVFKAAGEWIEKVTNAISDVTRASALEDEEYED